MCPHTADTSLVTTTWPLTAREQRLLEAVRELLPGHAVEAEPAAATAASDESPHIRFSIDNLRSVALRRDAIARVPSLDSLTRLVVLELSQDLQRRWKQAR
jgi:hypothetical protein